MKPVRPIALWLAAVIVTVAAALMPSGARAHGGHAHAAPVEARALAPSAPAAFSEKVAVTVRAVAAVGLGASHAACPGCAACGHAPSSCCATGLTPAAVPALAPPARAGRAPARDGPPLTGIVPEAQAEPPRPFA